MTTPVSLLCVVLMATCAARQQSPDSPEDVVRSTPEAERIVDLRTGEDVEESALLADLRSVRAIYLGEQHDAPLDHAMQYRILRALYLEDASLVVGMEMLQRPFQPAADQWVAGRLDEESFRRESEWDQRWGVDIRLYRPMLELIRSRAIPLYALNAPRELTRAVALAGVDGLSEEQRAQLPEMDLENAAHRAMVEAAMAGHPHGDDSDAFERLYQAQVVWDETMAESVANALEAGGSRIVVFAGSKHVESGLGIPDRAARRGVDRYRVVLAAEGEDEEIEALIEAEPRVADYLWVHRSN
ncbi:MAG: ChaN family lipoprotein [Myxococcota bacterium]